MLTADEQSRAAMGAAPAVRLSMLVQDLRSWMSSLLSSRIAHLDKGFLTRVAFHSEENLRSMVNRTSLQHQLLASLYPPAVMATFYQGHPNFDAAILEPMLSAINSWKEIKRIHLSLATSRAVGGLRDRSAGRSTARVHRSGQGAPGDKCWARYTRAGQ